MNADSLLVISDIDGTMIPNPYYAPIGEKEHAALCRRFFDLLKKHPQLWLATGRTIETYARLVTFSGDVAYPEFLLSEFGSDIYRMGDAYLRLPADPVLMECERVFTDLLAEMNYPEDLSDGEQGLHGVCLETKRRIMHVDWDLGSKELDNKFLTEFPERIRSLPEVRGLSVRVFGQLRRIDICSPEFSPKVSVWQALGPLIGDKKEIWVLGDDEYDRAMFEALQKAVPGARVRFASANSAIRGDISLECGGPAMDFAAGLFNGGCS